MAYAVIDDVRQAWPSLPAEDEQLVQFWLDYGELMLNADLPGLPDRVAASPALGELVKMTLVAAIRRVLMNPDGVYSTTRSVDDYSETTVRDKVISAGELYFLPAELARLAGPGQRGAFTITPYRQAVSSRMYVERL